jgi:lipoprotein-anchoring transpeptidase ErfK/SrfK
MRCVARSLIAVGAMALVIPAHAQPADAPQATAEAATLPAQDPYDTMNAAFGQDTLENGDFMWKDGTTKVDRLVLILSDQMLFVYANDEMVGVSTVSTGRPGHETRPGSFKILAKYRTYFSRKYDNAPMPFMQQITTYGVAFHAGPMPGYPASHGCIRLPAKFAASLFAVTKIGTAVEITE